jgi:hypothetical protein
LLSCSQSCRCQFSFTLLYSDNMAATYWEQNFGLFWSILVYFGLITTSALSNHYFKKKTLVQANLHSRQWYKSTTTSYKPTGPSMLPLQTKLLVLAHLYSCHWYKLYYHFLQTQWPEQTTASNRPTGSNKLPLQTSHCLKPNNQTRPDQTISRRNKLPQSTQLRYGHLFALAGRESCIWYRQGTQFTFFRNKLAAIRRLLHSSKFIHRKIPFFCQRST